MQSYLAENPYLIEEGLKVLELEKSLKVGDIDIYGEDSEGNKIVIELKRRKASLSDVSQLKRYVEEISKFNTNVRGMLIAPGITKNAMNLLLKSGLEFKNINPLCEKNHKTTQKTLLNYTKQ